MQSERELHFFEAKADIDLCSPLSDCMAAQTGLELHGPHLPKYFLLLMSYVTDNMEKGLQTHVECSFRLAYLYLQLQVVLTRHGSLSSKKGG